MNLATSIGIVGRQLLAVSLAMTLMACSTQPTSPSGGAEGVKQAQAETPLLSESEPAATAQQPKLKGEATVQITVNGKPITVTINGDAAPITAGNFVDLVDQGVYDGTSFHRVVRQPQPFVVQGGDPQSKDASVPAQQLGTGGFIDPATQQERTIPLEIVPEGEDQPVYSETIKAAGKTPKLKHTKGAVAMARSQSPDSASSQFYFTLSDLPFLDGDYAVFGYVTEGMDIVNQIQQGDRIESAKVTQGIENLTR
ncbi:Peptidyl-prolyl cis-trans isomerase A [Acaryochloris thomasi RCC1774]|uniref:Peptidyl-prolyl cis-trans isomerase n=1 Tax=Acaryochloris thomasi RCC1774 TaxID=1764569 RepID=A0A2W1JHS0_9CYAN|nr:peptidylprolyl isomerase [Acaryochloris thomasi]PZD73038.1 Peptidyl-prolyl cis-trans isomerase A [Acaryochloris thomasi RCC1774]